MTIPSVRVGVDGGGTHTSVGFSADGAHIQRVKLERPGRVAAGAEADAADRLEWSLREAQDSGGINAPLGTIVFGLAGAGTPRVAGALAHELAKRLDAAAVHVVTDAEIAFADAFDDGRGILLSAGTGSIAIASAGRGEPFRRAGGHGWRFGDEGSGYAVGRDAIRAVLRARDGGAATQLTSRINPADFTDASEPRLVAALTDAVCACFANGDEVSRQVVTQAVSELGQLVQTLAAGFPELPVAFSGGLMDERLPFRQLVTREIELRRIAGTIHTEPVDPVRGAIRLGIRLDAQG